MHFCNREDLAKAGVHGRPRWGIHGTAKDGAYAIVLNDGYEDDDDRGETMYVLFTISYSPVILTSFPYSFYTGQGMMHVIQLFLSINSSY